ncbi:class I SAM-dependent methyltransferase [Pseudonocardia adelaidensis]|uniref:Class I SAM-dependent methyltransferase n=1 Tax=Pseudonocardia adelaidensis TaxID=648754 RepID=A0ABP9NFL8_9PSEU
MPDIRPFRPQALSMEGPIARWYARIRGTAVQLAAVRTQAAQLTAALPEGARILEVAPGPGYLAVELARLGFDVTGVDLSATFVRLATDAARRAGVDARFLHGDAAGLPLPDTSVDLVVCQAAFKNFGRPVAALDEMHRVLRPGGTAVIGDMNRDATAADIRREVDGMGLGLVNAAFTRVTLSGLRRRAYAADHFRAAAAASAFGSCEVGAEGLSLEVRLRRG